MSAINEKLDSLVTAVGTLTREFHTFRDHVNSTLASFTQKSSVYQEQLATCPSVSNPIAGDSASEAGDEDQDAQAGPKTTPEQHESLLGLCRLIFKKRKGLESSRSSTWRANSKCAISDCTKKLTDILSHHQNLPPNFSVVLGSMHASLQLMTNIATTGEITSKDETIQIWDLLGIQCSQLFTWLGVPNKELWQPAGNVW